MLRAWAGAGGLSAEQQHALQACLGGAVPAAPARAGHFLARWFERLFASEGAGVVPLSQALLDRSPFETRALARPLTSRHLPLRATFLLQPLAIATAGARHQACRAPRPAPRAPRPAPRAPRPAHARGSPPAALSPPPVASPTSTLWPLSSAAPPPAAAPRCSSRYSARAPPRFSARTSARASSGAASPPSSCSAPRPAPALPGARAPWVARAPPHAAGLTSFAGPPREQVYMHEAVAPLHAPLLLALSPAPSWDFGPADLKPHDRSGDARDDPTGPPGPGKLAGGGLEGKVFSAPWWGCGAISRCVGVRVCLSLTHSHSHSHCQ
jgi:hypothetical protein